MSPSGAPIWANTCRTYRTRSGWPGCPVPWTFWSTRSLVGELAGPAGVRHTSRAPWWAFLHLAAHPLLICPSLSPFPCFWPQGLRARVEALERSPPLRAQVCMFLAWAAGESLLGLGLSLPRADRWPRPGVFTWLSGDQGRSCGSKVLRSQMTMLRGLLSASCPLCPRHCCRRAPQDDRLVARLPSPVPGTPAAFPGLQLIEVLAHGSLAGSCRVPKVPT